MRDEDEKALLLDYVSPARKTTRMEAACSNRIRTAHSGSSAAAVVTAASDWEEAVTIKADIANHSVSGICISNCFPCGMMDGGRSFAEPGTSFSWNVPVDNH